MVNIELNHAPIPHPEYRCFFVFICLFSLPTRIFCVRISLILNGVPLELLQAVADPGFPTGRCAPIRGGMDL